MVMVMVMVMVVRWVIVSGRSGWKSVFSGWIVPGGGKLEAVFPKGIFRKRGGRQSVRFGKFFPVKKS